MDNKLMNNFLIFGQGALMVLAVLAFMQGKVEVALLDVVIALQVESYKE